MSIQGRVLGGRYVLGSKLGTGGMASVYKATDRMLRRTVAVKVLHFPYDEDPAFVPRFQREARTTARLSHPNIVTVFDTGSDDDLYYIVMEYVDGDDLATLIGREGAQAPATAAQIAWSVCQALAAAHENGLVHRDVKPGNIIVSRAGAVKVTDFGIAKAMASATTNRTGSGSVLGTASYMSPEQAQGRGVDERSDLYSLGCVLYELLAGAPPFVNDTAMGVIWHHVTEDPDPLAVRRPGIDAGLAAVVGKALAKQPAERYQTAQAMGEDLERVIATLAPHGGPSPPSPTERAGRQAGPALPALSSTAAEAGAAATGRGRQGRLGWLLVAGLALVAVLLVALLRDGGSPAGDRGAGTAGTIVPATTLPPTTALSAATAPSTTAPVTTRPSTTSPGSPTSAASSRPPAPTRLSLPAALANLTEVLAAGRLEGTVAPPAYDDLVHKAEDVVIAVQKGDDEEARKKLQDLNESTDERIAKGEISPAAAGGVREAVADLNVAAARAMA